MSDDNNGKDGFAVRAYIPALNDGVLRANPINKQQAIKNPARPDFLLGITNLTLTLHFNICLLDCIAPFFNFHIQKLAKRFR